MIIVFGIAQLALWAHAGAAAQAAADHGAEVAGAFNSTVDAGEIAAETFLAQVQAVGDQDAQGSLTATTATMVVTGTYPSVFGTLNVTATATVTREIPPAP